MPTLDEVINDMLGLSTFHTLHVVYDYDAQAWHCQTDNNFWHPLSAASADAAQAEAVQWATDNGFRMISNWAGQNDETGFKRIAV
jgi:hypothetical protein